MPAPAGRGTIERIRRGAPDGSADMIDTPIPVAFCSLVVTGRPGPSPGFPGSVGSVVGDESPVHAAANSKDGTASVRKRKNIYGDLPVSDGPGYDRNRSLGFGAGRQTG